jgi:hypothetical protein
MKKYTILHILYRHFQFASPSPRHKSAVIPVFVIQVTNNRFLQKTPSLFFEGVHVYNLFVLATFWGLSLGFVLKRFEKRIQTF